MNSADKLNMLKEFSEVFGPSGFEDDVLEVARKWANKDALQQEDTLRNLYLRRRRDEGGAKPVVMLDAHTDEVGFMVQSIRPNGLLHIAALGGWVNYTLPAHTLVVKNSEGQLVPGVISSKPPHFLSAAERDKAPDISAMVVDIGAESDAEVREKYKIEVGAPAAPDSLFYENKTSGVVRGKAFDCRAGCAAALAVFNELFEEELAVTPVLALASQEEVGTRGAKVTAQRVKPDVAIVFEGGPADDTFTEGWKSQLALKKGPMLRHFDRGMITNPRFMRFALEVAEKADIPVQQSVREGGMTNSAAIHLSGLGIPTIVISLPVRYIHTHHGIAAVNDYEGLISLGTEMVRALTPQVIAGL